MMQLKQSILLQCIFLIMLNFFSGYCCAKAGIAFTTGHGTKQVHAKRISLQSSWFSEARVAKNRIFNGYWELAHSRLRSKQIFQIPAHKSLSINTLAAVLRIHKQVILPIYVDIGIGYALLSKSEIATRQLGSRSLFEDRLGVGIIFGRSGHIELGYRLLHYSNAYLTKKNNGLNIHSLVIGYWF